MNPKVTTFSLTVREKMVEAGQCPGGVITIPPINIETKSTNQGYDNKINISDDVEPTYIVIKLKD